MDGVTTPAIGPTALRWWHGSRLTLLPDSKSATASSGSSTRPSSAAPPISAPRSGPEARSHSIGGPACRNWPFSRPSTSAAGATSTRCAVTPSIACDGLRVGVDPARVGGDGGQVGLGARHRRAPVDALDGDGLAGHGVGEHVGADGDDGGARSSCGSSKRLIRSRARRVAGALERWTSAPAATRASRCTVEALRVEVGADEAHDDRDRALAPGRRDRRREQRRRVGLGAVAEHQVEQDHAGRRVGRGPRQLLVAQRRVDHRVRATLGEGVVAEVDHRVVVDAAARRPGVRGRRPAGCWCGPGRGRRWPSASTRRTACRRRRGRGAADRSPRRCCRRRAPATRVRRGRAGRAPPRRPRSGRAGRGRAGRARRACPACRRTA